MGVIPVAIVETLSVADIVDLANERVEKELEAQLKLPADMPKGKPGDCDMCGEWSGRLVNGVCAPCRERYRLGD